MKHTLTSALRILGAGCLLVCAAHAHLGERAKLLPADGAAGDSFGASVALDSMTAAVGAPFHQAGPAQGAVYVFEGSSQTVWNQVAKLTPTGAGAFDAFGASLAIDARSRSASASSTATWCFPRTTPRATSWGPRSTSPAAG